MSVLTRSVGAPVDRIEGRDKVLPEDVQAVLPGVAGHRLRPVHDGVRASSLDKAHGLISAVPIP